MSQTLKQYMAEMVARQADADGFGRIESITGLAAQSLTVAALAVGEKSSTTYQGKWLWRPDSTSTADRQRMCSAYVAATGVFSHTGAAYVDQTPGTEQCGVLEYEPVGRMVPAAQQALARLRFRDVTIIPTNGGWRYWLGALSWIHEPGDVADIYYTANPVLSNNRYLQKWNIANADTANIASVPDNFTAYGATATYQRITTSAMFNGQNVCQIVAPGGNVVGLSQSIGLLNDGLSSDNLQGKKITVVGNAQQSVSSKWRIWYSDDGGTTKTYGTFSTNTTYPTEMTLAATVSATASNPTFGIEVVAGATVQLSQCYMLLNAISDGVRKDTYTRQVLPKTWDQSGGASALTLLVPEAWGLGGQIEVHSKRAYPTVSADTDTVDAPLTITAVVALWMLYRGLASTAGEDDTRYREMERRYELQAAPLIAKHWYPLSGNGGIGVEIPRNQRYAFPVRVG